MSVEWARAATALIDRFVSLAAHDEAVRRDLRELAELFLKATEREVAPPLVDRFSKESNTPVSANGGTQSLTDETLVARFRPELDHKPKSGIASNSNSESERIPRKPLPELTLGQSRPVETNSASGSVGLTSRAASTDFDPSAIEARCRLKAEGIRWAVTRHRLIEDGAEFREKIAPGDRAIVDQARALSCFLWMNFSDFLITREFAEESEKLAGSFLAVADIFALLQILLTDTEANRDTIESSLALLAEAQSSLRVLVDRLHGERDDQDQVLAYSWLREITYREKIYVRRYMRLDDPADPERLGDLELRIKKLSARSDETRQLAKNRKAYLGRLRYHAKVIGEKRGTDHDWKTVVETVVLMLDDGTPASNLDLRRILLPILDLMPEYAGETEGFQRVLRDIDQSLASGSSSDDKPSEQTLSPDVAEVARRLTGSTVVLIGGIRRPQSHEALKDAFQLKELIWIETREHASIDRFEPYVARLDVGLVLLAIRWSSHSFGEVKRYCERYGKPMVRLPGGYNPNQVAAQILDQSSEQLKAFS